jgi:hypothetical protein
MPSSGRTMYSNKTKVRVHTNSMGVTSMISSSPHGIPQHFAPALPFKKLFVSLLNVNDNYYHSH